MPVTLSAVIPTRNRPDDLAKAVGSVLAQSRLPDEFIIIDQSPSRESRIMIESLMMHDKRVRLSYVHDPSITGLVDAKRVAASQTNSDIVCFLEDDVILEPDYLEQIELGFFEKPDMVGCCGIVTNAPSRPLGYELIFHLFHRGIFRDKRVGLFRRFNGRGHDLVPSETLSGGLSAWRREVLSAVPFDVENGFFMLEDIDFSTRVARHFGPRLYINPNARLEHRSSPINRESIALRQRRKLTECIVYYKKRRESPGASLALAWLLFGLFFESTGQSFMTHSIGPMKGYFSGMRDGFLKKVTTATT